MISGRLSPPCLNKHARQIVVHHTGKDAAQHYPQVRRRAELGPHDGAEDRSQSGNVEKLNHKYLPRGKRDVVHPVSHGQGRRLTVVRAEDTLHKATINKIAGNQRQQAKCKCNHGYVCF